MTAARRIVAAFALASVWWGWPASAIAQDCTGASATGVGFVSLGPAAGYTARIVITAPSTCPWSVLSDTSSIAVLPPSSGTGTGQVNVEIGSNPGGFRSGFVTLTLGSQKLTFTMSQGTCISPISTPGQPLWEPPIHYVDRTGGRRYLKIAATTWNCSWQGVSFAPWIRVAPGGFGEASELVTYEVEPNTTGEVRYGRFSIGPLPVWVFQSRRVRGDIDGDGHADLLWHHETSRQTSTWLMNGTTQVAGVVIEPTSVPPLGWNVVGAGSSSGGGVSDILWQHDDGRLAKWEMVYMKMWGADLVADPAIPSDPDWRLRAFADLNSDGRDDLIWQHRTTGAIKASMMFDDKWVADMSLSPGAVPDTDWHIVGAGDFNHDGQVDLLWQHQTLGLVAAWLLKWTGASTWSVIDGTLLSPGVVADTDWKICGVADLDGDGNVDLLWHHQTLGLVAVWLMNGLTVREGQLLSPGQVTDTNWKLVGPR